LPEIWWHWIRNPVDVSIFPEEAASTNLGGSILSMMAQSPHFDVLVSNVSTAPPSSMTDLVAILRRQIADIIDIHEKNAKPLAVVLNTGTLDADEFDNLLWKCIAEEKAKLLAAGIAVYSTPDQAAHAIIRLISYYQRREAVRESVPERHP
jgi:acyl-CoA synthetase (NDP forming)